MKKKYTGMVFKKDPTITVRTQEEREVLEHLERKVHNNDLEDDFFLLAEGLREEVEGSSDESSILEFSNEESYAVHNEEERQEIINIKESMQEQEKKETLTKDCLSSLVEQVNLQGSRGFGMLSNFLQKKKKPTKKQKRANTSIEACNSILNRMGSYIPVQFEEAINTVQRKQKVEDKCSNWEDLEDGPKKNQPNII